MSVFGLGDSSYAQFNYTGKRLFKRLQQLGATAVWPRGDGDDQHYLGLDGAFDPWFRGVLDKIKVAFPSTEPPLPPSVLMPPCARLTTIQEKEVNKSPKVTKNKDEESLSWNADHPCEANVVKKDRLTHSEHFQEVWHLEFDNKKPDENCSVLQYEPGDVLAVRPRNNPDQVQSLLELLQWTSLADVPMQLQPVTQSSMSQSSLHLQCKSSF